MDTNYKILSHEDGQLPILRYSNSPPTDAEWNLLKSALKRATRSMDSITYTITQRFDLNDKPWMLTFLSKGIYNE